MARSTSFAQLASSPLFLIQPDMRAGAWQTQLSTRGSRSATRSSTHSATTCSTTHARSGLDVDANHVLADKSTGTDTDRAGYRELMDLVEDGAVDAIVAVEDEDWSHRKASRHSGVSRRTIPNVLERKELYLNEFDG